MRNQITDTARQLRDMLDAKHAAAVSLALGCPVTLIRREPVKRGGQFTGINELVYGMPAEFIEQATALGLLAEVN